MIEPISANRNIQAPQEPEAAAAAHEPVQEEVAQEPPVQAILPPFWYGFVCGPDGKCTCQAIPNTD